MRRFFVSEENIGENSLKICGDDFSHIKNVLRLNLSDEILAICGNGKEYHCKINSFQNNQVLCDILEVNESLSNPKVKITLFQGLPKGEKFEFVIQKMTELGVSEIIPFESDFTIAKAKEGKLERWNKISREASKQCGRASFLEVKQCVKFKDVLEKVKTYDQFIFAYENENSTSLKNVIRKDSKNIAFIVGSEGGFSEKEQIALVENGAISISLGRRILRTETASVALASVLAYELGEWNL